MATQRASVKFIVKESESEPAISVEQLDGDKKILPANIYFELASGTSLKAAQKIAELSERNHQKHCPGQLDEKGGDGQEDNPPRLECRHQIPCCTCTSPRLVPW